ncbi:MAG: phage/plasmid primase, P4 family [Pseudomonadota bacterium]
MIEKILALLEGAVAIEDEFDGVPDSLVPPDAPAGDDASDVPQTPFGLPRELWEAIEKNACQPQTDIGNARRFLTLYGHEVFFLYGLGWFVFDGRRWAHDESGLAVRKLAHKAAETIQFEARCLGPTKAERVILKQAAQDWNVLKALEARATELSEEEEATKARLRASMDEASAIMKRLRDLKTSRRRFARTCQNKGRIEAMMKEAEVYRPRALEDLDVDAMMLNTAGGTLRFARPDDKTPWNVFATPHSREDLLTKITGGAYDEAAKCPKFENFLQRIVPDEEVRAFLKRWFGYVLTGLIHEQVFVFFYGEGANGKSTLVDIIARVLGDYAVTIPFATLAGDDRRKGGDATPDLVRLPGARMVRASEPEVGVKLKEAEVKAMTGGEPILIRRMREEFIEVWPLFKLVLSGNHKPEIRGGDHGIWRRTLIVPFEERIPQDDRDPLLSAKLWEERDGILNWLIAGCLEYLETGLEPPDAVRAATDEHRDQQDEIGAFAKAALEAVEVDDSLGGSFLSNKRIFESYQLWCQKNAVREWSQKMFSQRFGTTAKAMGAVKHKRSVFGWLGLRLLSDFDPGQQREGDDYPDGDSYADGLPGPGPRGSLPPPAGDDDIPF